MMVLRRNAGAGEEALIARLAPRLAGQRVAVIGNARSLAQHGLGAEIDACGLILRLNAAPCCAPASHGTRTDWLAASVLVPGARLGQLAPERLLWMSPRQRLLAATLHGWRLPLHFYPRGWWRGLARGLGSRPSTGVMAIDLILRIGGHRDLQLFGFDFFQSGSLSRRMIAAGPPHDFAEERRHVMALAEAGRLCIRQGSA